MPTQNDIAGTMTEVSGARARPWWIDRHRLLAYTLIAYGISWSLLRWRVNPLWYAFVFLGVPLLMLAALAIIYQGQLGSALAERWSLFYTQWPIGVLSVAVVTG